MVIRRHPDSKGSALIRPPRSNAHLALLGRLTRIFHSSLDPAVTLRLALQDTVKLLRATSGSVALINPETGLLEIEASVGLSSRGRKLKLQVGEGVTGWVALQGAPARVADVGKDPRYVPVRRDIRSELAVPLERASTARNAGPEVVGVLNVDSIRPDAFTSEDEKLLVTLAGQVSSLIHNAWLYEQSRLHASRLDSLFKLGQSILAIDTLPELLQRVAQGACRLMRGRFCAILLLDSTGANLRWSATSDEPRRPLPTSVLSVDNSHIGSAVRRVKPVAVEDIQRTDPLPQSIAKRHRNLSSMLVVPLFTGEKALGALALYSDHAHRFSDGEIQLLTSLAGQASLVIQRCHLSEKLVSTEEELRQSERLSSIGLLAAEVAHEIRNPLTVIKMLTHSLERELPHPDPRRKDFEILGRKLEQMNRTVERVLSLARDSEPIFESLSLNSLVEDLVLLTRHKMSQQQVRLLLKLCKELPSALIDRALIEQALLNVILNALHAMPRGGALQLYTGISPSSHRVWVEVRDSGCGMSTLQKEKLFQPFLTSRPSGTGLGMAIVDKIIQAHHGEIHVRSRPGHGTSVRITLLQDAHADQGLGGCSERAIRRSPTATTGAQT